MVQIRTDSGLTANNLTPEDFLALEQAPNIRPHVRGSFVENLTTTETDIWPEAAPLVLPTVAAAVAMEVVSSSGSDDVAPAVGARTVRITGLDAGYVRITQDIALAGVVPVAIPTALRIVERLEVLTFGTTETNVGVLRVRIVAGAVVQSHTPALWGQSIQSHFGVAAGETFLLKRFQVDLPQSIIASFRFIAVDAAGKITSSSKFFTGIIGNLPAPLPIGFLCLEQTTVRFLVQFASGTGNDASAIISGFAIDNSVL